VVGFKAIASAEDGALFSAIRNLSVVKEDPAASPEDVALAEARLAAAAASARYVSESTKASRLYWWTAEYGLVGQLDRPRIYGAGLLSSLGEAQHCLTPAVRKIPLSVSCTDVAYDITRMQPQLFVARDFDHLFEVLEAFEKQLAWRRGGDYGLEEAIRARSVNHLLLDGALELTGRVTSRTDGVRPVAQGLHSALARLEGPILVSRNGTATGKPWIGHGVVVFGGTPLPERGSFDVTLPTGLRLTGFVVGDHEVVHLRGELAGKPVDLPSWALLFSAERLAGVAGGPADPGAWDRWFGDLEAFGEGDGEARARAHKAAALSEDLAVLYRTVRQLREAGGATPERLRALAGAAEAWPGDWLLRAEIEELRSLRPGRP
jgi:phenylalanine-4-hydroxylase